MGENDENSALDKKKSHRERHSGRKAEKKKKKQNALEVSDKQKNPKAFAFNSAVRAERRFRRKQDIETKKQHIPVIDRTPIEPPPVLVAVVGPPKVGKSTVINNLIKLFTKSPLTDVKGPVTIVTGKKRRITFIECNNDINAMIDIAKVADLVLLLIDASFGFEMEIFEFLNICQVHGMPRIMGVLTHLDMIKNSKTLKNTKKMLKHRFWTEVYPGAKLFYLSGIVHGEYLRNEVKNLGRFISVIKFRPLTWRTTHSYLLADRYEDLTSLEQIRQNKKCDRNISLYGYMRGIPLNKNTSVHIAGLGDFKIQDISFLPDPCPLPELIKKRSLIEKEKLIYAPFSGVGGIVYDKDAVYVELGGSHSHQNKTETNDETRNIVSNLIETRQTLDEKMLQSEMQIFTDGLKITADDLQQNQTQINSFKSNICDSTNKNCTDSDLDEELNQLRKQKDCKHVRRKVVFQDDLNSESESDESTKNTEYSVLKVNKDKHVHEIVSNTIKHLNKSDSDSSSDSDESKSEEMFDSVQLNEVNEENKDESDINVEWKDNLSKKARDAFIDRQKTTQNIMKLVYGVFDKNKMKIDDVKESDEDEEIGGLFRVVSTEQKRKIEEKEKMNAEESSLFQFWDKEAKDWLNPENKIQIENCFVTGKWKQSEDASELLKLDDLNELSDDNSEIFGDFEDLESGEKHVGKRKHSEVEPETKEALVEKKRKLKEKFDAEYDNNDNYYDNLKSSTEKQAKINKEVFEDLPDDVRVQIEGFRAGMYVRIELENVPAEFVTNFDPTYPLIIGGLNIGEENIGYVNVKLKKHRWYKKILKTTDPLIISLGWRRFQTIPLFSKLEDDLKYRYLKYTPEHVTCNAHFWGPITPQGTGFVALQSCDGSLENVKQIGFRVAATGSVQELEKSTQIMKKLKLIGYPMKIYKKTAFIKDMFNSSLEVAKFEGARIKTVSGIRGQIKKAVSKPEGCFRATFEDKILLSDIVFCRTWYKVDVPKFYCPITTLLLPPEKKNVWQGVRTKGQLKRDKNIQNEPNYDSLYTPIEREPKVFKPLVIPRKLQKDLPYRDKPKFAPLKSDRKRDVEKKRVAVIREPHEQKVVKMLKMLRASYEQKQAQEKAAMSARMTKHQAELAAQQARKQQKEKRERKEVFRAKSKAQIREEKKGGKKK